MRGDSSLHDMERLARRYNTPTDHVVKLAGDHPENWRATTPRTGGRPSPELAGDHPQNWQRLVWRLSVTDPSHGG